MSLQRTLFRAPFARRSLFTPSTTSLARRTFTTTPRVLATQDYGSGAGDPKGEDPQSQGTSKPTRDVEHPGPSSPADKSGGASTSSTSTEKSKDASSSGSSSSKSKSGAQPKIHNPSPPAEEAEDVKKHNEEMDQRADKAHEKSDDQKVGKDFWKGHGGVDRQP